MTSRLGEQKKSQAELASPQSWDGVYFLYIAALCFSGHINCGVMELSLWAWNLLWNLVPILHLEDIYCNSPRLKVTANSAAHKSQDKHTLAFFVSHGSASGISKRQHGEQCDWNRVGG